MRTSGVVLLVILFALAGDPAAIASASNETSRIGSRVGDPAVVRVSPTLVVICRLALNSPHFSVTFGSVVAKARVNCYSNGPGQVSVNVSGTMSRVRGGRCKPNTVALGPGTIRWAGTNQPQMVVLNAVKPTTFYLPRRGGQKLTATATWYAVAKITLNGTAHGFSYNRRYTGPACP